MKKLPLLVLLSVLLLASRAMSQTVTASSSFITTNLHSVATNITSTNLSFFQATLVGMKAGGVSNAAIVYVGSPTGMTYYAIAPGERHRISPPAKQGEKYNFKDWGLRTPTTGDGLYIIYQ
jgi:hypothetical protein